MPSRKEIAATLQYAGAFIAWVIGSGFATGQEILQFFTSYGRLSYAVVLINLIGFLFFGNVLLTTGFAHRDTPSFDHYRYYCGKRIGAVYSFVIPATLLLTTAVLMSAAGATLYEFCGWNKILCSAGMGLLVLAVNLIGFEKMVGIVSKSGPVIVVFTIFISVCSLLSGHADLLSAFSMPNVLAASQAAPHWSVSALLYLSLNFLCGCTYYTALGRTAISKNAAKWGALLGAAALVLAIGLMNTAILQNAAEIAGLNVPILFLAERISPLFGSIFLAVLLTGVFSSCSTMLWSFCSRFFPADRRKNRLFSIAVAVVAFLLSLFPFNGLVSVVYPLIGYIGLIFLGCVVWRTRLQMKKNKAPQEEPPAASVGEQ